MYYRAVSEVVLPRNVYTRPDIATDVLALNENKKISYLQLVRNLAGNDPRFDIVRTGELPEVSDEFGPTPYRREHIDIQRRRFGFQAWKTMQLVSLDVARADAELYRSYAIEREMGELDDEIREKLQRIEEFDLYA